MNTCKRIVHVLVLLLFLLAQLPTAQAEDRRPDPASLTIMTFNAEFLWDGVEPEEGNVEFPWKFSKTEAEEHMAKVAEVIIRANPDIVNLVEVENLEALTTLNDTFLTGRGYRPYLVKGKDTQTGQDVALLTRIDPETIPIERDDRQGQSGGFAKSVSKNYLAKIQVGNRKIALIGVHLIAFPQRTDRKPQREAQAEAIRGIATDVARDHYLPIVLGDFNDYDDALDARDHLDSQPITTVLRRIREMDAGNPDDDLKSVASFVPKAKRYTAFYDANRNGEVDPPGEFTVIDHILVAPALVPLINKVDIPHDHDPRFVSDHFPVVVRFALAQTAPQPTVGSKARIAGLLPNPPGDDGVNEEATIVNLGTEPITFTGWKLRDLARQTWTLDSLGTLDAGQSRVIKRNGQPMALNNTGDTIDLIDPTGAVVHTVTYGNVAEGEIVTPANN